ncbi:hypothetical protein ASPWEDRAFT_41701 [Aspergillus wentii DTO 134E9]|uniref:Bacterial collagen-like protein middle domain-containing protein n=1 Tax=Aspergillus wentii DTO 134E9 TaxID=1073089 RepID=A0A1L9RFZ7_ASPWE|nr:uncharacterized protein ASPWEDRAFT_41701 [Aspergillus wentii DTO 134E9]KAI9925583.1 hypothetical protein MW887_005965 [Aspergillus wentii]OJJ33824.1 hypothetical protein ASPWEDRAFT_41701 [Aspergillus wentii DTO 134E9]
MKASFFAAVAALASTSLAAPTGLPLVGDLVGDLPVLKDLPQLLGNLPVVSDLSQVKNLIPSATNAAPSAAPSGKIVQDVGHEVDSVLTVTGPNAKKLLIKVSPEVAQTVNSVLPGVGTPIGAVVASAASVGDLVTQVGHAVDGVLTVTGEGVGALLIELDGTVSGLLSGLGLGGVGKPVGDLLGVLGANLKRDHIVQDLGPQAQNILTVTGSDSKQLLVQVSGPVSELLANLGLLGTGKAAGQVIKTAGNAGDLVKDIAGDVNNLIVVTGKDTGALLIQLDNPVTGLLASLGLGGLGQAVGEVVKTVGESL